MRNAAVISVYEIRPDKGLIVNAVVPRLTRRRCPERASPPNSPLMLPSRQRGSFGKQKSGSRGNFPTRPAKTEKKSDRLYHIYA